MSLEIVTQQPEIQMSKREKTREGIRENTGSSLLWYDSKRIDLSKDTILERAAHLGYTGVVLYPENLNQSAHLFGPRIQKILHLTTAKELETLHAQILAEKIVVSSDSLNLLSIAKREGATTCFRAHVDSALTLQSSIAEGLGHDFLMVSFLDPTNIPLELIIASLDR